MENCIPEALTCIDTIQRFIIENVTIQKNIADSVTIEALKNSESFYSSKFDKLLIIMGLFIPIISILIPILLNFWFNKNIEGKIREEKENLRLTIIKELQSDFDKFKTISYFIDQRDMQTYRTVKIGSQVWMAENLNYVSEEYNKKSRCYKDNPENAKIYGRLYDWETAKNVCPKGWRLPTKDEWQILVDFAGGYNIAGNKLKTREGWSNNGNGTDELNFSALPGGLFNLDADADEGECKDGFIRLAKKGVWWSSTEMDSDSSKVYSRGIDYNGTYAFQGKEKKTYMLPIRCIKI